MIRVENLSDNVRLKNLSLTVSPGQVLGLVGSAGSGKTSLIRILAGQAHATAGSASVGGVDCRSPQVRRLIGVAGASWGFLPRHTVWENLLHFAALWGLPKNRATDLLKILDLVGIADTRAEQLKAGEEARLRLARALLHDPPALLLDEPLGDIDRESTSLISFAISEQAERGKAILLATYGHPKTLELCTHLVYLEDGRLFEPEAPGTSAAAAVQATTARDDAPIRHIAARRGERIFLFAPEEIQYAFAQEKSVYIQTADGPSQVTFTLTELEERLEDEGFFRCHRGFLVNVKYVKEIVSYTRDSLFLLLKDGKEVPLSKHRAVELKKRLGW